jgi:Arc/MetJ family transcription regulator
MKMTMHIDGDVLAQVMEITGAKSKTKAVEIALSDLARRHRLQKVLRRGLGLTPDQLAVEFAPGPADQIDPPDFDDAKVQRFIAAHDRRKNVRELKVAEDSPTSPDAQPRIGGQ